MLWKMKYCLNGYWKLNYNVMYLLYIFNVIPCIFIFFHIVFRILSFAKEIRSDFIKSILEYEDIYFVYKEKYF